MFSDVFVWLLKCMSQVFGVLQKFKLDKNISYFDFLVFLSFVVIVVSLIKHIRADNASDARFLNNMERQYDFLEYKKELKRYDEKGED